MSSYLRDPIGSLRTLTRRYAGVSEGSRTSNAAPVRHKCFVSYHSEDADEVLAFVDANTDVFIPRAIGLEQDGSDIIDSDDVETIRREIRDKYLWDSTVTIVAIGKCTWARKFIDWEIYASLRNSPKNKQSGLLAIQMPSVSGSTQAVPARLSLNLPANGDAISDPSYARYYTYPSSKQELRRWIDDAFQARTTRDDLLVLGDSLRKRNSTC